MYKIKVTYNETSDCNAKIHTAKIEVLYTDDNRVKEDKCILLNQGDFYYNQHLEWQNRYYHNCRYPVLEFGSYEKSNIRYIVGKVLKEVETHIKKIRTERKQKVFEYIF